MLVVYESKLYRFSETLALLLGDHKLVSFGVLFNLKSRVANLIDVARDA